MGSFVRLCRGNHRDLHSSKGRDAMNRQASDILALSALALLVILFAAVLP